MAFDVVSAAETLVDGLIAHPWGGSLPSVYETGRLVSLTPWLTGHPERLRHLLDTQLPDGSWGAPHPGYSLIPTLSATEAILTSLRAEPTDRAVLVKAADQALDVLFVRLNDTGTVELPDMPAIEHIVPGLVHQVNAHLNDPPQELATWSGSARLRSPVPADDGLLDLIGRGLRSGRALPKKLLHALEIAGDAARGAPGIRPESDGTIGGSPAATAAWLGDREPSDTTGPKAQARRYLETAVQQYGGPVPCAIPITVFERAWVLSWLARAGIPLTRRPALISELASSLGPTGTAAGPGLPPDADTTGGTLYALSLLGAPQRPDMLWEYETETHFCTWPGEDGRSVSTNAHVLEAFGHYLETGQGSGRHAATAAKVTAWLCDQQQPDGSWHDRWHASPYYATYCCVMALHRFGDRTCAPALQRAAQWAMETQRPDGSWGLWGGTAEETAYALHILRPPGPHTNGRHTQAIEHGRAHLLNQLAAPEADHPALWHDKDLYLPPAMVRAAVLAAVHLTRPVSHK